MIVLFSVKIRGVNIGVSFSFFAVTAIMLLYGGALCGEIFTALVCCVLHELGHLTFMALFSDKPESVVLYGGGIRIRPGSGRLLSSAADMLILLSGCAVNFLAAGIWYLISGFDFFCAVNLLLGVFNLLPFKYFDGGRALEKLLKGSRSYDIIRALFIFLAAVCVIQMNLNGALSVSFALTFFFVVLSEILY